MPNQPVRKAVIPAAGRGTRFLPFTKAVPKELAPIVTTPAIELVVAEAAAAGITDVLFVVSPGKEAIAGYFGTDDDLARALAEKDKHDELDSIERPTKLAATHFVDQLDPKGLGHAVAHGAEFSAGEPVVVLLPDDVMDDRDELLRPMLDVYAQHGGVVVGLLDVGPDEISNYGCVVPDDGADPHADVVALADLVEKPAKDEAPSTLAIIGRYVLPPEIFTELERTAPGAGGEIQLTDAMLALRHSGTPVHGVVFRGRRYDTGNKLEYVKAVVQLAARHPDVGSEFRAWLREYEPDDD